MLRFAKKLMILLALCALPITANPKAVAPQQIIAADYLAAPVHRDLIDYALKVTEQKYGPASLQFAGPMVQGRAEQALQSGITLQLVAFSATQQRETDLLAVYFPLTLGLQGYRVCLIASDKQPLFNAINTLEDWRQANLVIGQGAHWPDVDILRANNLLVTTNPITPLLFEMLVEARFECYLRSLNEVQRELTEYSSKGISLEQRLLFYYPQPAMLFVPRNYPLLAQRLEQGLTQAFQDGFMQKHFMQHYGALLKKIGCDKRQLFLLENPLLSAKSQATLNTFGLSYADIMQLSANGCAEVIPN